VHNLASLEELAAQLAAEPTRRAATQEKRLWN
jgi:hypothetical protein